MTTNELTILSIIWSWGGEASVDTIAREAGISPNYAELLCRSLAREDYIDFVHSKLSKIKSKGKLIVAGRHPPATPRGQNPQKIVIPQKPSKFGFGKDKRGRLILNYG